MGLRYSTVGTLVAAGALGVLMVVGCSADGSSEATIDEPVEPEETGASLPPPGSSSGDEPEKDAGKDAAKKDASKDSAVDAGPPPPVAGDPCTTANEIRLKQCGACGKQSTVCLEDGAGMRTWSDYGSCDGELVGGCIPGTVVDEACGNCGTLKKTCSQYCAFGTAACTGQPADSCVPGSVDLQNAGCPDANTFRSRTCSATCVNPNLSLTCGAAPTTIEVGPNPGNVSSTVAIIGSTNTLTRFSLTTCPTSVSFSTIATPYVYYRVHNPLAKQATVAIFNSNVAGSTILKTTLAAYDGVVNPTDDVSRKACLRASTTGTAALTGDSKYASLDNLKTVVIPAGGTVSVYVASYNAYDAAKPLDSTGKVKLSVQTVSLQ